MIHHVEVIYVYILVHAVMPTDALSITGHAVLADGKLVKLHRCENIYSLSPQIYCCDMAVLQLASFILAVSKCKSEPFITLLIISYSSFPLF